MDIEERNKKIISLYMQGHSIKELAIKYKLTTQTISQIAHSKK